MTKKLTIVATAPTSGARARRTSASVCRRSTAIGLVAVAGLLLAACSQGSPKTSPPVTVAPTFASSKTTPPKPDVPVTWPLTGVVTAKLVERPALAIKIENPREGRPQTGLEAADMVWEEVVEGGVTRYVAVFHSIIPGEVGPLRSVRPMDPAITAPLKCLVVFSGGEAPFVNAVRAAGLQVLSQDTGSAGFFRTHSRPAPHNLNGTPSTFLNQADASHKASPPPQFTFARSAALATAAVLGTPAHALSITMSGYSHPSWTWSAADSAWLRSEASAPAMSAAGARLSAQNVLIMRVNVVNTQYIDPTGTHVPQTVMIGSGEGLLATGGKTIKVTWSKASDDAPVKLKASGVDAVLLAPGKTWIQLVPIGTGSFTVS